MQMYILFFCSPRTNPPTWLPTSLPLASPYFKPLPCIKPSQVPSPRSLPLPLPPSGLFSCFKQAFYLFDSSNCFNFSACVWNFAYNGGFLDPQPRKSPWILIKRDYPECPGTPPPPAPLADIPDRVQQWGCFPWGHLFWLSNQPKFQGVLIPKELLVPGRLSPAKNPGSGSPGSQAV